MKSPHFFLTLVVSALLWSFVAPIALAQNATRSLPRRRQLPPPALIVGVAERSEPLQLRKAAIEVKVVGHVAETEMTLTFYNPNGRALEGDLYFPLPEGSTVSGYALDVNGTLVDGVVVPKEKARRVFETEVRKGVDPGLVEWTAGNNFKTRIFPIPAKGSRTVRVNYTSEVAGNAAGASYHLPLNFRDKVKDFSLRVEVVKAAAEPVIVRGGPAGLRFGKWNDSFVAESSRRNVSVTQDLHVRLPRINKRPVRVETAPDGQAYFSIRDLVPHANVGTKPSKVKKLGIYWDASLSRESADHAAELEVLRQYLGALGDRVVCADVVVFRDKPQASRRFELPSQRAQLIRFLRSVDYDGATQLGGASPTRAMQGTDVNLLFSDGISNFGVEDPKTLTAPVYAINGASTANHAFLRYLALRTGGAYFNLQRITPARAAAKIGAPVYSFVGAEAQGARLSAVYPRLRAPVDEVFTVAGRLTAPTAKISLKYGVGDRVLHTRTFTVSRANATQGGLLRNDWAQKKLADLMVFPKRNEEEIIALGREFSIVTPGTSLLVLERLGQYVEHDVRPPASLASMRAEYDLAMKQRSRVKQADFESKLEQVITMWNARVAWWEKSYDYPKNFRYGARKEEKTRGTRSRMRAAEPREMADESPHPLAAAPASRSAPAAPAKKKSLANSGRRGQDATIALKPWNPQTPYLSALKAASQRKRYAVYLEQRKSHGGAPAFYLDCSDYFYNAEKPGIALRVLSNLAEMELEDPALLRILGHRLAQRNELDLSAQVFEQVLKLRPEEPQSYRDLALVLARRADANGGNRSKRASARADYTRALELLAKVVMGRWDRFSEIEVMALTELNDILPRARKVGVTRAPVDERLIKHLDMDVRIVMTWDADMTDMDLHVVEPSDEEAFYGHNRTTIGGMVSRDFTRGYGPEVYAVRRAMKGKYKVRTKFFGSSTAKLGGAVTLQVDVYTNYGRANEKRESMTLRLTENKEVFTVGEISF